MYEFMIVYASCVSVSLCVNMHIRVCLSYEKACLFVRRACVCMYPSTFFTDYIIYLRATYN